MLKNIFKTLLRSVPGFSRIHIFWYPKDLSIPPQRPGEGQPEPGNEGFPDVPRDGLVRRQRPDGARRLPREPVPLPRHPAVGGDRGHAEGFASRQLKRIPRFFL